MKSIGVFLILAFYLHNRGAYANDAGAVTSHLPEPLYGLSFHDLERFRKFSTDGLVGHRSLWIVFQPDCASCKTQLNDLSCLPKSIEKVAVGFGGSRDALNRSLRFTKFDGHRVISNENFQKMIDVQVTPTLLLVDSKGHISKRLDGVFECSTLNSLFTTSFKKTKTQSKEK